MTELEKMMSGQIFDGTDKEIEAMRSSATHALMAFNNNTDESQRDALQKNLFGKVGRSIIQAPLHCEFGKTIEIGEETFINMNVVMLDGAKITIGNHVLIGLVFNSIPLRTLWITVADSSGKPFVSQSQLKIASG